MAALDDGSESELELEDKEFTIAAHTFRIKVVGELPLETLFALESNRDEISGQRRTNTPSACTTWKRHSASRARTEAASSFTGLACKRAVRARLHRHFAAAAAA